jgi:UDP-2,3-diacylglucosamine pyrophosphatase LpxH
MIPNKVKLVISDFHLGRGTRLPEGGRNPHEDFHHDNRFREFLEYYNSPSYSASEIELIYNGDMLNLIQTDYHGHYTAVITEEVSITKLNAILAGHEVFFSALRNFLALPGRSLTYIVGNHDQEMLWPKARQLFEHAVGTQVTWRNIFYDFDGVHIEHGHQYEAVNRMDPTQPFLTEGLPEPILNLPWGSLFAVQFICRLKHKYSAIDKERPFRMLIWWLLLHDTLHTVVSLFQLVIYFISTRFSKNRYRQTSLKMTLKMLLETSIFPDLTDAAKKILRTPDVHTVIFGHTHVYKYVQLGDNKQYLNTGTWIDILSLDLESYNRAHKLTYIRIEYTDTNRAVPLLRHWIGTIPLEDEAAA